METLEIELSQLRDLIDEDVLVLLGRTQIWSDLQLCASTFDIDISNIKDPNETLHDLIMRKADQSLPEAKANAFKRVWETVNADERVPLLAHILMAD